MKIFTLEEILDHFYGKKGTKNRDQFDKKMRQTIIKALKTKKFIKRLKR